jgi:RNA polymerase sigma-70 factor (ECF subfamily)
VESEAPNQSTDEWAGLLLRELRAIAATHFSGQPPGHTLQPTALLGELWLRAAGRELRFDSPAAFKSWASAAIRSVLVDHARRRRAAKRGGGVRPIPLEGLQIAAGRELDVLEFESELCALEDLHSRSARVVQLRFYGGMTDAEIAQQLGVSERTVRDDWVMARAWLRDRFSSGGAR